MQKLFKRFSLLFSSVFCYLAYSAVYADDAGIGKIADTARGNLGAIAQLITAGSYVAGMAFGVAAVTAFKAHKDNPTQSPISKPIALLFISAALLFIPSVFTSTGATLFGGEGQTAGVSGVVSF